MKTEDIDQIIAKRLNRKCPACMINAKCADIQWGGLARERAGLVSPCAGRAWRAIAEFKEALGTNSLRVQRPQGKNICFCLIYQILFSYPQEFSLPIFFFILF